ncbi:unnamed protein product [Onchocerca flexuosa]|uniref:Uncharacterized protein n=1 Tax=Onchocerca flexuosa TaxID=387005 RepID=A0A183HVP1_9BILA|nr:unnamed protein product [Onchocerca flexuosa]
MPFSSCCKTEKERGIQWNWLGEHTSLRLRWKTRSGQTYALFVAFSEVLH